MIASIVDVALRAAVTSVVVGAVLAALVALAIRATRPRAATRHALWTIAMLALAFVPLTSLAASVARATRTPATLQMSTHESLHPFARSAAQRDRLPSNRVPSLAPRLPATISMPIPTLHGFDRFAHLSPSIASVVAATWALGALGGLAGLAVSLLRVRGLKKRSHPLEGRFARELPWLTQNAREDREIYLRLSEEIETPLAIGFRRPVILIPTKLATVDGLAAIEELIIHEHAHLDRYDDWTNLIGRAIERIFWFNPVVWIVGRRIALEREIASDDAVVARTGQPTAYASSLWQLAREMRMPEHAVVAPGALFTRKQISIRIESLLSGGSAQAPRPTVALAIGGAALAFVVLVATSAPALQLPALGARSVASIPALKPRVASPHPIAARPTRPSIAKRAPVAIVATTSPAPPRLPATPTPRVEFGADSATFEAEVQRIAVARAKADAAHAPADAARIGATSSDLARERSKHFAAMGRDIASSIATSISAAFASSVPGSLKSRSCNGCDWHGRSMRGADLRGFTIAASNLEDIDLRNADLRGAHFLGSLLKGAKLDGAVLVDAHFDGSDVDGMSLHNAQTRGLVMNGVSLVSVDLHDLDVRALLAHCFGCDLMRADLHGADLHGIKFDGMNFEGADLRGVDLRNAKLYGVNLVDANLDGADLRGASFEACVLQGARMHDARITGTHFANVSMEGIVR